MYTSLIAGVTYWCTYTSPNLQSVHNTTTTLPLVCQCHSVTQYHGNSVSNSATTQTMGCLTPGHRYLVPPDHFHHVSYQFETRPYSATFHSRHWSTTVSRATNYHEWCYNHHDCCYGDDRRYFSKQSRVATTS